MVRDLIAQERASLVCLQETKLTDICSSLASEILGSLFDYDFVPSLNAAGGILLGWRNDLWVLFEVDKRQFFISVRWPERMRHWRPGGLQWSMGHKLIKTRSSSLASYCCSGARCRGALGCFFNRGAFSLNSHALLECCVEILT